MRLTFDIETDGLIRQGLSKIHCIVIQDLDSKEEYRFDPTNYRDGLQMLLQADELWGHNIVGYDIPAIQTLFPNWRPKALVRDTLILSRLLFTDILDRDFRTRPATLPANLYGRHSLESWGHRLGVHKSDFGKGLDGDWSVYTTDMLDYCAQDVVVSVALAELFLPKLEQYAAAIDLEHRVAEIMSWQEAEGFPFDVRKAQQLESELRTELDKIAGQMRDTFYFVPGKEFTPKRDNKVQGYFEGASMVRLTEFNPTSRFHIGWAFQQFRGWEPTEFTTGGQPKIDESILKGIGTEESLAFARILELQKHLGQLSEGKNAWLKNVTNEDKLHHSCVLATNTGRMAHMRPNLAQVPSAHEYRELFNAGPDRVVVGADASGLELRCLAHYLAPFDNGQFAEEVVNGDIHTHLASIYGTDRKSGKGVTYCLIYGGGNSKLGITAGASPDTAARKGSSIRKSIMSGLAGFKQLSDAVNSRAESGVLKGLDGRPIRLQGKNHAALNYLLQSAGAIICKKWLVRANELLQEAKIDYTPLAFVHDEVQLSVHPDHAQMAADLIIYAMKDVEHDLKFRCQLDSEAQSGATWADTH